MRENNRNTIEIEKMLPQFTTMNVIDGQAGIVNYSSLIFYSLTIDNILNIIVLLILAGVTIATLTGENGILTRASEASVETRAAAVQEQVNLWKTEKEAGIYTNTSVKSESELLEEMKDAGILFEEEIDRENQIITIDNKTIYYGEGKPLTDIYVALYNDGTLVFNSKDEFDTSKIVESFRKYKR